MHISKATSSHMPSDNQRVTYYDDNMSSPHENATSGEQDQLLLVAKRMTLVSLYYEFAIGCLVLLSIFCCIYHCCTCGIDWSECSYKTLKESMQPFILFDCAIIILLGPFGNVYLFMLGCWDAYVTIVLRIGFYLSTVSLPAVFSYLHNRKDCPEQNYELKSFVVILFKLALKLVACSSCLATFINIAYPERPIIRFTYLSFTVLIGLSALLTYYETLLKLVEVVQDWVVPCMPFHEWFNHFTFWPTMLANLGLVGLNAFILYKYFEKDGPMSSGISLALNVLSLSFTIPVYVLGGIFCGRGPLYKECRQQRSSTL